MPSGRASPLTSDYRADLIGGIARARALVGALSARLPNVDRYPLPAGEACKSLAEIERTCQWLAERGYDRQPGGVM